MKNWETTIFGILSAVGQVMQQAGGVPHWFNVLGGVLSAAGVAGMGYSAASIRGVQRQIDEAPDTTTLTIKETTPKATANEKTPTNPPGTRP